MQLKANSHIDDLSKYVADIASAARTAAAIMTAAPTAQKNHALLIAADLLDKQRNNVLAANSKDMDNAKSNNLAVPLLERLALNDETINSMITSLKQVASLADPIGETRS